MTWEHIVSFEIAGRPTPKGRPRFGNGRTITVGSCRWFTDVWVERGWTVTWEGEWEW